MTTKSETNAAGGGIGFLGMLFLLLLALKLTGVIGWSWWWVTAPLWVSPILGVVCLLLWLWLIRR